MIDIFDPLTFFLSNRNLSLQNVYFLYQKIQKINLEKKENTLLSFMNLFYFSKALEYFLSKYSYSQEGG